MSEDEIYMHRALQLAAKGRGYVSPNPMVGCVIVYKGNIIGEGFHRKYGENHAEVEALNKVTDKSVLSESTLYVTLEPCAHFGKTPPCAPLIVSYGVKRVVVATIDPFGLVDGRGIEILKSSGIDVQTGICKPEAEELNKRFFYVQKKKKPFVILKWAETADRYIAKKDGDSKWISGYESRQLVHKWRTEEDAILVGKNTVAIDNPMLTSRLWSGKNPKRIVLDSHLSISENSILLNDSTDTIVLNTLKDVREGNRFWIKMNEITPDTVLEKLHELKIQSVIIEGGSQVLTSFIQHNCWNEARVFSSPTLFKEGKKAPDMTATPEYTSVVGSDLLKYYYNPSK